MKLFYVAAMIRCCGAESSWRLLPQNCNVTKVYYPTAGDQWWRSNINSIAESTKDWYQGCKKLQTHELYVTHWLDAWAAHQHSISTNEVHASCAEVRAKHSLPYLEVHDDCDPAYKRHGTPACLVLEPLIGFLRHPRHICFDKSSTYNVNKDYMFVSSGAEVFPKLIDEHTGLRRGRAFLFDLGCSSYGTGSGGASQNWFVDQYRLRGIEFDRILAWEMKPQVPSRLFGGYPPDILGVLSYFNVPVESDPGGKENPLRIMLDLCTPADFIVIKIDIDNAPLEHAFIDQIIQNPRLHGLIDELFFEHHVERSPMEFRGWHETVRKGVDPTAHRFTDLQDPPAPPGAEYVRGDVTKDNDITASYAIFNILRELGIRAHSWV